MGAVATAWASVGSIPDNPDAQNVPSFRRWRFEMKLSPVLTAFIDGVFRAAVRLWKFIMPRKAKDFFQTEGFHPASLDLNLQKHLGLTSGQ